MDVYRNDSSNSRMRDSEVDMMPDDQHKPNTPAFSNQCFDSFYKLAPIIRLVQLHEID